MRQRLGPTKFGGMNTPSRIRPIRPIGSHEHAIASGPSKASCSGAAPAAPLPASKTAASAGSLARPLPDAFVPVAAGAPAALASGRSPTDGAAATGSCAPAAPPPRLLDRVRHAIRVRHYAIRTESAYVDWAKRFILFHGKRHPAEMRAGVKCGLGSGLPFTR